MVRWLGAVRRRCLAEPECSAVERSVTVNLDDPKTNPAAAFKAVIKAAQEKHAQ